MRLINQTILDAANAKDVQTPSMLIDVYASTQARGALDTEGQWAGATDPMVGSDTNMSYTRIKGAAVLGAGAAVAAVYGTTPTLNATLQLRGSVVCRWHAVWNWKGTSWSPAFDGWTEKITTQVNEKVYPLTAQATIIADSIIIRADKVQSAGLATHNCYVYLADSTGRQIGNRQTFAPTATTANYTITNLQASLSKGRKYFLVVGFDPYTLGQLYHAYWATVSSSLDINIYSYTVASASWRVPVAATGTQGFCMGGDLGFAASGSFTRQMVLSTLPTNDGFININDVVPAGTTMNVALYYTDNAAYLTDATLANWTFYANVQSGNALTQHQYWRINVSMTSNATFDETPQLQRVEITYKDKPYTLGTHIEQVATTLHGYYVPWKLPLVAGANQILLLNSGAKCIHSVSASSSKMNPQLATSITGKLTVALTPEPLVIDMMSKPLRGKQTVIKAGYLVNNNVIADKYYEGIVSDANWNGSYYTLTIEDDLNIADTQIPTTKAGPAWDSITTFGLGDIVVYGNASYESLQAANLNNNPATATTWWTNIGTVWQDIVYTSLTSPDTPTDWHLADVCEDILTNHVNLPSQRIDFASIAGVKALYPNMRGSRTLSKPVGAIQLLTELAWLLRSQWVMRQGKIALMPEPDTLAAPVATIGDYDIKKGITYRRGWAELKNTCLILSGYSGDGSGQEQFYQSYVYADTTSIANYEMSGVEVFQDKWAVIDTELTTRATEYVNRWKDGRRVISYSASMRLLELEVGDVVTFSSVEMPPHDRSALNYIIVGQDIDWLNQTIKHTLLEA